MRSGNSHFKTLRIISLFIVILFVGGDLYGEDLEEEGRSIRHALFIGATFIPIAGMDIGTVDSDGIDETINWYGRGFSLDCMYVTGLFFSDREGDIFLSLNASLGYIQWREKVYSYEGYDGITHEDTYNADKGYSLFITQKLRLNGIAFRTFGMFFELGVSEAYHNPRDLDPDEHVSRGATWGPLCGMGFVFGIPSSNQIFMEFGVDFTYLRDRYIEEEWRGLFVFIMTLQYEIY